MKSSILHLLSLFLIVGFAASCGKKSESSGGSTNVLNPYSNNPNISQSSSEAYATVKAWYDAADTANIGNFGDFLKTSQTVTNGFSGSFSLCILGMGVNCQSVQPNGCYSRNGDGTYRTGTPTVTNGITTSCNPTVFVYTKAGNAELVKAVLGNGLVLLNASRVGTVTTLAYGAQNAFVPSIIYTIDTSLHSLLNPVMIQEASKITTLKGFRIIQ
jgi:hypothetical protein